MITTAVFFYSRVTFRTLFRIGCYPIRRLRIVVAFLLPFLQQNTPDGIVPVLTASETKFVSAPAYDGLGFCIRYLGEDTKVHLRCWSNSNVELNRFECRYVIQPTTRLTMWNYLQQKYIMNNFTKNSTNVQWAILFHNTRAYTLWLKLNAVDYKFLVKLTLFLACIRTSICLINETFLALINKIASRLNYTNLKLYYK